MRHYLILLAWSCEGLVQETTSTVQEFMDMSGPEVSVSQNYSLALTSFLSSSVLVLGLAGTGTIQTSWLVFIFISCLCTRKPFRYQLLLQTSAFPTSAGHKATDYTSIPVTLLAPWHLVFVCLHLSGAYTKLKHSSLGNFLFLFSDAINSSPLPLESNENIYPNDYLHS